MATLPPELISWLEMKGLTTPPQNGMRKISVSVTQSFPKLPLSSEMIEIPEMFESVETLRLAGFSNQRAEEIFTRFKETSLHFQKTHGLDWFAIGHIRSIASSTDACRKGEDYASAWRAMGMQEVRIEGAMAEELETMRCWDSASGHFIEAVRDYFVHVWEMKRYVEEGKAMIERAEWEEAEREEYEDEEDGDEEDESEEDEGEEDEDEDAARSKGESEELREEGDSAPE